MRSSTSRQRDRRAVGSAAEVLENARLRAEYLAI
jgi:hypothetical protein